MVTIKAIQLEKIRKIEKFRTYECKHKLEFTKLSKLELSMKIKYGIMMSKTKSFEATQHKATEMSIMDGSYG